jgi:hypothetical protein
VGVNLTGLYLGLYMLAVIGAGFAWVIWLEYTAGAWVWKIVLATGLLICLISLFLPGFTLSALVGIFGGSVVWGATELPGQEERVRRGLFRANPKRGRVGRN